MQSIARQIYKRLHFLREMGAGCCEFVTLTETMPSLNSCEPPCPTGPPWQQSGQENIRCGPGVRQKLANRTDAPARELNARYTHRIAISNSRITACDGRRVTFRVEDYRKHGEARYGVMTLAATEFARRFLQLVQSYGFHRIRHVGFRADTQRRDAIDRIRGLLADRMPPQQELASDPMPEPAMQAPGPAPCPCCGGRMMLVDLITPASPSGTEPFATPAIGRDATGCARCASWKPEH